LMLVCPEGQQIPLEQVCPSAQQAVPQTWACGQQVPLEQAIPPVQQLVPQTRTCGQQVPLMLVCPLGHWLQTG